MPNEARAKREKKHKRSSDEARKNAKLNRGGTEEKRTNEQRTNKGKIDFLSSIIFNKKPIWNRIKKTT